MHRHKLSSGYPKRAARLATALAGVLLLPASWGAVSPETTRAIFNAGEQRIALSLANSAERPALVQLWLDNGDPLSTPQSSAVPVAVLPPVFRMLPGEIRSVQMVRGASQALPRDRESLFWLNIYQVPPMNSREQAAQHKLVVPLRVRMKLFVRPEGIAPPEDAGWQSLRFSSQKAASGESRLAVTNPTPWYITLDRISCGSLPGGDMMVAPKSTLTTAIPVSGCRDIRYRVIDDQGNKRSFSAVMAVAG
ncbi:fimbria/pilus periplasmic chaperone [Shimwellia pseudoproteus]|uniref:fimbria/pilus periplasmic chaperone n=1 Tax=Shimwellia pseudoproteus TaxID=570012 RepID=UPI0018EBC47F|nr:fimbria/pilus periplasmic chaperone [Shimwellia pseudoproteus]